MEHGCLGERQAAIRTRADCRWPAGVRVAWPGAPSAAPRRFAGSRVGGAPPGDPSCLIHRPRAGWEGGLAWPGFSFAGIDTSGFAIMLDERGPSARSGVATCPVGRDGRANTACALVNDPENLIDKFLVESIDGLAEVEILIVVHREGVQQIATEYVTQGLDLIWISHNNERFGPSSRSPSPVRRFSSLDPIVATGCI